MEIDDQVKAEAESLSHKMLADKEYKALLSKAKNEHQRASRIMAYAIQRIVNKPDVVRKAEILLVGIALIAASQYIRVALYEYTECLADGGSIVKQLSALLVTFPVMLFLFVLGGVVIVQAFPSLVPLQYMKYRRWVRYLMFAAYCVALWTLMLQLDEVVGWSYRSSINLEVCPS